MYIECFEVYPQGVLMVRGREKHIQEIILRFFQSLGMRGKFDENLSIAFWDTCVGKEIARHTDPQKVVKGTMFVRVDSDVWRNELSFLKNEIIQKINHKVGKEAIKEIKFY